MTNLLSGRHKYLTYKNTKKGQKVLQKAFATRKAALSALKNGDYAFAAGESCSTSCPKPFFLIMISFFLHSVSANLMIAKKRANARKTPEIVRFRGFEAMISFLASRYGCGTRIRTQVMTESESVALPLGDTPKFKCLYILSNQLKIYKRFWGVCGKKIKFLSVYLF